MFQDASGVTDAGDLVERHHESDPSSRSVQTGSLNYGGEHTLGQRPGYRREQNLLLGFDGDTQDLPLFVNACSPAVEDGASLGAGLLRRPQRFVRRSLRNDGDYQIIVNIFRIHVLLASKAVCKPIPAPA